MNGGEAYKAGWVSLHRLARDSGVPEASARRYVAAFADFFKARKAGKYVHFAVGGGPVLVKIAGLFAAGLDRVQVAEALVEEFGRVVDVGADDGDVATVQRDVGADLPSLVRSEIGLALSDALLVVADQKRELENQRGEIKALLARVVALELRAAPSGKPEESVRASESESDVAPVDNAGEHAPERGEELDQIEDRLRRLGMTEHQVRVAKVVFALEEQGPNATAEFLEEGDYPKPRQSPVWTADYVMRVLDAFKLKLLEG